MLALTNQFLIAMPGMADPNFSRTLTLICEHNQDGALGFVINRPTAIPVSELLSQQQIECDLHSDLFKQEIFAGGPVEPERGFILHTAECQWEATLYFSDEFCITASKDIIAATAQGEGPEKYLFLLGYSGWGPGQLEAELSTNSWLTAPASADIVFDTPAPNRWKAAASRLGVNIDLINQTAGHA